MKVSFAAACILAILVLAAPRASAQQLRSYHCIATSVTPGASHITIYVSQLIPLETAERADLNGAWATYIKSTYHLQTISSAVCQPLSTNPTIQERTLTAEENAWTQRGWEVVRVTWKPGQSANSAAAASLYSAAPGPGGVASPAAATAGTPAPASTQGPEPSASYCFSDDHKPTIFFSDAFDTAGLPSSSAWSTAFTKFLAQKYAYKGTVTCKNATTIVSAQSMMRDQREGLQNKQLIDTDWTYEPPVPPAPSH